MELYNRATRTLGRVAVIVQFFLSARQRPCGHGYGSRLTSGDLQGWRPGLRSEARFTAGTHASHVLVKAIHVLAVPEGLDLHPLAAIPYSFTTMWLAVRGAGLTRENAPGKSVLVHGAAGGLGTLATQMLSAWGARVTAIARRSNIKVCLEAGATEVVERTDKLFGSLGRTFDATLNFATWEDDLALLGCLRDGALGHATTVHPMLGNFDRLGWLRGMLKTILQKKHHRRALPKGANNFAWVLFKPDKAALADLRQFVEHNHVNLPIGLCKQFSGVGEAFDHVRKRQPGRALLAALTLQSKRWGEREGANLRLS